MGLDHTCTVGLKVPAVSGVYLHNKALFEPLLGKQTKISKYLMGLLELAG